jgi:OOP family OmpA-OmpF porin
MTKILPSTVARVVCAAVLFSSLASSPVSAEKSPYWIVLGGGYAWLPNEFLVKPSRPQFGAIIGARMSPSWATELHGSYLNSPGTQPSQPTLSVWNLEGNLTWFMSGDRTFTPYLTAGAGLAYLHYEGAPSSLNRFAFGGGPGFRLALGERTAFRLEGRVLRFKIPLTPGGAEDFRHEPEAFAGISFGIGGPPSDKDHDGVVDDDDRCPGTPAGARVDPVGCALDSDEDGVFDGIDQCNNSTPGAAVDARGCELDRDGDGVVDGKDTCPDTPTGATVDASGCPHDADLDLVPDGIDQCPSTAKGCIVNPNGCPTDSDGDGVCDGVDDCPDTPATAKVDKEGCPILVSDRETQLLETGMIRLQNINFETGKSKILTESEPALDEVGNILARWPQLRIEIGGHTDSRGSARKNSQLSRDRAEAVLEYMMYKFPELNPAQFTTVGYGMTRPIATNATALGRAKNRRVEFKVLNKEALKKEKTEQRLLPRQ